jgi:ClpP class serine protease
VNVVLNILWIFFIVSTLQPVIMQRYLEASRQRLIAKIERKHGSRVILLVHREEIALAADRIVMCQHAVLGPIDPQLGEFPAASILKVVRAKPVAEVDDQTLVLADQAEKAIFQLREAVKSMLATKIGKERAAELAEVLTEGTWTHDYPITFGVAEHLGLPVGADMPDEVLQLKALFPQAVRRTASVEYLPKPRHLDRPDSVN